MFECGPLEHLACFGFLAPSQRCRLSCGHSELPIRRDGSVTRAAYHWHRQRSVNCFTDGRKKIYHSSPLYLWWPTFENYADVVTRTDFAQAFINTLMVSTSAVVLSLCVGVPAAYAFARFPFTGRTFLFFALLVMRMLPPIAVLVPMYVLFSKLGLATTRFSVVLADTTKLSTGTRSDGAGTHRGRPAWSRSPRPSR